MLNRLLRKIRTTILLLGGGLAVLAFAGCDNFLKGNQVRDEIMDAIAYNNANSSTIYFKADSDMGEFFPEREKIFKVGYEAEVQFSVNLDRYVFKGLEAVCVSDLEESRAEYVSFEQISANDKKGVYIYNVKLLKEAKDILIRPICFEFPSVISHTPSSSDAQYANTPIIIKFNMPMEEADVSQANSIFNYKNISLIYTDSAKNNTDMSVYFDAPAFNSTKDTLTLVPKSASLKTFIDSLSDVYIDINVSFDEALFVEKDGVKYLLKQNDNSSFKVRYNSNVETEKPVKSEFFVTKDEITLANLECQKLNREAIEDMTDAQILQNRVKDFVYLYGKYYDKDSGVEKVIVTVGNAGPVEFTADSEGASFATDENGYTQFCIKCNLNLGNDAYLVNVAVADVCGNVSTAEEFYVISRTSYEESEIDFTVTNKVDQIKEAIDGDGLYLYTQYVRNKINTDGWDAFVNEYNSITRKLRVYPEGLKVLNTSNGTVGDVPVDDLTLYCEYTDKTGQTCKQRFVDTDNFAQSGYLSTNLNVDSLCGMTLKIIVEDNYGAQGEFLVYMPPESYLSQRYKEYEDVELIPNQTSLNNCSTPGVLVYIDSNDQVHTNTLIYGYDFGDVPFDSKKVGFFFWTISLDGLYTDFIPVDISTESVRLVGTPVVEQDENNCVSVTFELASDTWEKFEKVEFNVRYPDYWNSGYGYNDDTHLADTVILTKENTPNNKFTYKHDSNYFYHNYYEKMCFWYDDQSEFWFTGISETFKPVHGGAVTLKYPLQLDEAEYDDLPPIVDMEPRKYNYFTFILKDVGNGSGPASGGKINISNSRYDFNFQPRTYTDSEGQERIEYITEIQTQQMYDRMIQEADGTRKLHFTYTASDNAGNSVTDCPYDIELDSEVFTGYTKPEIGENSTDGKYIYINNADDPDYADVYYIKPQEGYLQYYWTGPATITTYENEYSDDKIYPANADTVLEQGNFVKICPISKENNNLLMPLYAYSGYVWPEDSSYNYMIPGSNNSVVIGSMAPVLVATYTTKQPYEVCKTWTAYEWRMFGEESWVSIFDFSTTNTAPRNYTCFPPSEEECAVAVAFFVNGTETVMSDIMQKKD